MSGADVGSVHREPHRLHRRASDARTAVCWWRMRRTCGITRTDQAHARAEGRAPCGRAAAMVVNQASDGAWAAPVVARRRVTHRGMRAFSAHERSRNAASPRVAAPQTRCRGMISCQPLEEPLPVEVDLEPTARSKSVACSSGGNSARISIRVSSPSRSVSRPAIDRRRRASSSRPRRVGVASGHAGASRPRTAGARRARRPRRRRGRDGRRAGDDVLVDPPDGRIVGGRPAAVERLRHRPRRSGGVVLNAGTGASPGPPAGGTTGRIEPRRRRPPRGAGRTSAGERRRPEDRPERRRDRRAGSGGPAANR